LPGAGGLRVALLGGDERELVLCASLIDRGFDVVVAGLPDHSGIARGRRVDSVHDAVLGADAVVCPMSGADEEGVIKTPLDPSARLVLDEEAFARMREGTPLFIGLAKPKIERLAAKYGVRLIQLAEVDEVAILNSIPTAEGAIARAMAELPVTLHASRAVVVGFGRCGLTLARMLGGIGARVRVVARDRAQLARAFEMGFEARRLEEIEAALSDATVVFNTVPALVLGRSALQALPRSAVVIDIASAPGGTDFAAAADLGVKAYLELGIPGKVAPKTAGEILARVVPQLILDTCGR